MKDPQNIKGLLDLCPDFVGFIFYKKSPRYNQDLNEELVRSIPKSIKKVGVFVNESLESILKMVRRYELDYVQLHGDEDLDFTKQLKANGVKIIKVFRVMEELPEEILNFQDVVDYYLFDTASKEYGGSGKHFNWDILEKYDLEVPFLLSGGIDLLDIDRIHAMDHPKLMGVDVNSRFEYEPGKKDLERVKELKSIL